MRRRKPKYCRIFIVILLLCLIIGLCAYWFLFKDNNKSTTKPNDSSVKQHDNVKESSIKMVMVGDALIHSSVYNDAKVGNTFDFSPMFSKVSDFFKSYDLVYYNQETPFGGKALGYKSYPVFNTPSEIGDQMLSMGFNLVSLATNHTMDMGAQGAINSLQYWNSKKDVIAAGSYLSEEARKTPVIKEKNGITYTMLSYATMSNLGTSTDKPYLLDMYNKEKVKEDIERVRNKVDLLIVAMHWGTEYANKPNDQQKEIAAYLASLGVDIVIGTHTHSIEPIQYIDGTLVFYSLGNFISGQLDDDNLIGLMPTLKVNKRVENGKTTINISDLEARLVYTYYKGARIKNGVHTDHKIVPFDQITTSYLPDYKKYYEKYKQVITSMDNTITVGAENEQGDLSGNKQ